MPSGQLVSIITIVSAWYAMTVAFMRHRRRTGASVRWQDYKSRLPSWVKSIESLIPLALWLPLLVASVLGLHAAYEHLHPDARATPISIVLFALSSAIATCPVAMLIANQFSFLISPIRRENLRAMAEVGGLSFASANRGLALMALVIIPICAIQVAAALVEPWAR